MIRGDGGYGGRGGDLNFSMSYEYMHKSRSFDFVEVLILLTLYNGVTHFKFLTSVLSSYFSSKTIIRRHVIFGLPQCQYLQDWAEGGSVV